MGHTAGYIPWGIKQGTLWVTQQDTLQEGGEQCTTASTITAVNFLCVPLQILCRVISMMKMAIRTDEKN